MGVTQRSNPEMGTAQHPSTPIEALSVFHFRQRE